jgi:hypothetical protein
VFLEEAVRTTKFIHFLNWNKYSDKDFLFLYLNGLFKDFLTAYVT